MISKRYFKTKDEVDVTFKTSTVGPVEGVSLLCDFNGWNPIPMRAITKRTWKKTVRLPIDGEFQFRYLLTEGTWFNDDAADGYRPNEHGTDNCIVRTTRG